MALHEIICQLPGGYFDQAGQLHRQAELTPVCGREEELLAGNPTTASAALATTVLSRCVRRLGAISPVTEAVARDLLVADRQYLLLWLRAVTFGDRVRSSVHCTWPDCRKRIDITFSIDAVPIRESIDKGPCYTLLLSPEAALADEHGEQYREVTFRLPNGGDQEALAPLLATNEAHALTLLLQRCIRQIGPIEHPDDDVVSRLSALARMQIEQRMEALVPRLELTMETSCAECGHEFAVPFDIQSFFFSELRVDQDRLYREVHHLAYHYHWSEQAILDLTRAKRQRYIDLLAEELESFNDGI